MLQLANSQAPRLAAGLAIARIGDLAIGDHLGPAAGGSALGWRCTGNLWGAASESLVASGPQPRLDPAGAAAPVRGCFDVAVHQTALYDLLSAARLFGVLVLEHQPRATAADPDDGEPDRKGLTKS